jgi:hypothetical protein
MGRTMSVAAAIAAGCLITMTAFAQRVPADNDADATDAANLPGITAAVPAPTLLTPPDAPTPADPLPDPFATGRVDPFADPLARQPRPRTTQEDAAQPQQSRDDGLLQR